MTLLLAEFGLNMQNAVEEIDRVDRRPKTGAGPSTEMLRRTTVRTLPT